MSANQSGAYSLKITVKIALAALLALHLAACSSPPDPPQPVGPKVSINSEQLQQELNQGLIVKE